MDYQRYGFERIMSTRVQEIDSTVTLYRFRDNGAELLSVENEDQNKVFGITFRTPPPDSTGVAHILEHSVLCGSGKYPVKEPFVELLKGSLQTFLNAMTFPDKTCYPVASQNVQDFYNLIDVYLDAVFHPRITEDVFAQEGWHLEYRDNGQLTYQGVVYNEMKGAYSSPDSLLSEHSQQSIFPGTPYGLDSGGHPEAIPDLTFEQFSEFHRRYYHPSNARLFFYGDDDPEERLRLAAEYLSEYQALSIDSHIPLQPRIAEPKREEHAFPADEGSSSQARLSMNWLLDVSTDTDKNLAFHILETLLIGMTASPLRKALIDSGLGEDLTGIGLEADLRQMFFSTGLKGVEEANLEQVEDLILRTLEELSWSGFDPKTVEAAINSVEFELRENNTGSMPRGLLVMIRSLSTWLYGGDPTLLLAFEEPLANLKARIEAGEPVFETLLREYFLDNRHRSTVVLRPDQEAGRELEKRERDRLAQVESAMDQRQKAEIEERAKELKRKQEAPDAPEDLARIPRLKISDLPSEVQTIPLERRQCGPVTGLFHDLPTNGIAYLDLAFDLRSVPQKLLGYVPLLGRAFVDMGTEDSDFVSLSQRIEAKTGGIHSETFTQTPVDGSDMCARLILRGKSMLDKIGELTDILDEILGKVRLDDRERFRQIVLEEKARLEHRLIPAGHRMINLRIKSRYSRSDWVNEHMNGVSQLLFLRFLVRQIDSDWPRIQEDLQTLKAYLVNRRNVLFNLTLPAGDWSEVHGRLERLGDSLPEAPEIAAKEWKMECMSGFEGLAIPAQVNYVGKGLDLFAQGYTFHASSLVISRYLRNSWLWDRIRVQGGAYGAFCLLDHLAGSMIFVSYRDPNVLETLNTYDSTAAFLEEHRLDQDELDKAVIGAIGDMDRYELPDAKGMTSMLRYLIGETDERRQAMRQEIFETTPAHFREFGGWLRRLEDEGFVAVMGDQTSLTQAKESGLPLEHFWQIL
jgi:hypothetical protein